MVYIFLVGVLRAKLLHKLIFIAKMTILGPKWTPICDPQYGPQFWTHIMDPIYGPPIWTANMYGPRFWTPIIILTPCYGPILWTQNMGPQYGPPIWTPTMDPL
jgi:hypothetical protein